MKWRYKTYPKEVKESKRLNFNIHACCPDEILTGDGSVYVTDLEVLIDNEWKCLGKALQNRDVIINNYNTHCFFPKTEEDRKRGFTLT